MTVCPVLTRLQVADLDDLDVMKVKELLQEVSNELTRVVPSALNVNIKTLALWTFLLT